jgi:hypothetical protein
MNRVLLLLVIISVPLHRSGTLLNSGVLLLPLLNLARCYPGTGNGPLVMLRRSMFNHRMSNLPRNLVRPYLARYSS